MSKQSLSAKAALLIILNLFKYAIGFMIPIFLVRVLTKDEYGTYQQLLLISAMLIGVMRLGLPQSIYYFYTTSEDATRKRALVLQTVVMLLLSGILSGIAVFMARDVLAQRFDNPLIADGLFIYALYIVFYLAAEYLVHVLISQDKYKVTVYLQGFEAVVRAALIALPFLLVENAGLIELIWSISIYAVLRALVYLLFARSSLLPLSRPVFKATFYVEQLKYSIPLMLTAIVGLIGRWLDRLIISLNFSTSQYAVYSVGALELPLDVIFQQSVHNVLRATLPPLVKEKKFDEVIKLLWESVRKLSLVILPIFAFIWVFSEEFIVLLFTEEYRESVGVFRFYLLLVPLHIFVLSPIPQVFGRTMINFHIFLVTTACNIVLSLVLVKTYGYYGPVIATVLASYGSSIAFLIISLRLLNTNIRSLFPVWPIFFILGVSLSVAYALSVLAAYFANLFIMFVVLGSCYLMTLLPLLWFSGLLKDKDKDQIIKMYQKLRRRHG